MAAIGMLKRLWQASIKPPAPPEKAEQFFGGADEASDPALLRHALEQLIFTRIITLSLFLTTIMISLATTGREVGQIEGMCWSIAVVFAVSIGNLFALRKIPDQFLARFAAVQFGVDVILATGAIAVTNTTVAMFLYLFLIVAAALVLGKKAAVILAAESGIAYSILTARMYSTGTDTTSADVLSVYLSLVSVAVLSSYLAKRFEVVGDLAKEQARRLSQLHGERAGLFEDLSEAVILLDQEGKIAELNQAALSLFGWTKAQGEAARGDLFRSHLESLTLQDDRGSLPASFGEERQCEVRLRGTGDEPRHCAFSTRPIRSGPGEPASGAVVLLSDRSHERTIEERLRLHEKMTQILAEQPKTLSAHHLKAHYAEMAGDSVVMKKVFELIERVAPSSASVLIQGESGTGKELIARAIHQRGPRSDKAFVAINCGALPENLIESELFGHKKGAFTGAATDSAGLFRQAQGGTLFLDEIGELPLHLQTKLLRVLQEKTVRAVGDTRDYPVDVRVLAATNRELRTEVQGGRFREDLYYRLNVVSLSVPPLRERKEDIPLLVRHFFERICGEEAFPQISPEAIQLLMQYPFPGNIRELENIIERAIVLGGHAILPEHLPEEVRRRSERGRRTMQGETKIITLPIDLEQELETLERAYLQRALNESNGVKKAAAEMLGLNFRSFRYRLKKYSLGAEGGLSDDEGEEELQG